MTKTRLLLSAFALIFVVLVAFILNKFIGSDLSPVLITLIVLCPAVVLFSSVFLLIQTFFNLHETVDGDLIYNPDTFFYKKMGKFYEFKEDKIFTLCELYWKANFFFSAYLCLAIACVTGVFLVGGIAYFLIVYGWPKIEPLTPRDIALSVSITSIALATPASVLSQNRFSKCLALSLVIFALVIVPVYMVGIVEYAKKGSGIVMAFSVLFFVLFLATKVLAWVTGAVITTKWFEALKTGLCPLVVPRVSISS